MSCSARSGVRLLGALLLLAALGSVAGAEVFRLRDPGEPMPAMTLYDLDGKPHPLEPETMGKPVLLFFWSVYCPNCKEALPGLVETHRAWADRGIRVWAVNVDGARFSNAVQAFVGEAELPFPVLYDRLEGEYFVAADALGVSKTPTLYLSGSDGRIVLRQVIEMDFDSVAAALDGLALR